MKSFVSSLSGIRWAAVAFLMWTAVPASAAIVFTFSPTSSVGNIGDVFEQRVLVSGLTTAGVSSAPSLGSYDITFTFNDAAFSPVNYTFGDPSLGNQLDLAGFGTIQSSLPSPGSLNVAEISFDSVSDLDNLQADAFELGRLTLKGIQAGTWNVTMNINSAGDSIGNELKFTTDIARATIQVNDSAQVPEPMTSVSVAVGLAALAFGRRFRRS